MARPPKNITSRVNEMLDEREAEAVVQEAVMMKPPEVVEPATEMPSIEQFDPELQPESAENAPEIIQAGGKVEAVTEFFKGLSKRTEEAEKKVLPPVSAAPIQKIGEVTIVRKADDEEIQALNDALGGDYIKGLNFPAVAEADGKVNLAEYLAKVKDANPQLFEQARRGTLNYDALMAMAQKQGLDNVVQNWITRKPGAGESAEQVLAGMIAARQVQKETTDAFLYARTINDPEERAKAMARAMQLYTVEMHLYANLSASVSEAGRTLYAVGMAQRLGIDAGARGDEMIKIFDADSTKDIEYLGELYLALPDAAAKARMAQQGWWSRGMDVVAEAYINSLLGATTTHAVNIFGNSSFMLLRSAEQVLAGSIGRVRTGLGIGKKERAMARDGLIQLDAIRETFLDAILVAGKAFIKEEASDLGSKIDLRARKAISMNSGEVIKEIRNGNFGAAAINALGVATRIPGRFLLAEDEFFKAIAYRAEIRKTAKHRSHKLYDEVIAAGEDPDKARAMAVAEEKRILENPPEPVVKDAQQAAQELTFQGDLNGFMGTAQPVFSHPAAKLFVPFFKTPMNVLGEVAKRSPLRALSPQAYKNIWGGGAAADAELSRIALGAGVMSVFSGMAWDGNDATGQPIIIVGAGPSDPDGKAAMQRLGIQPFSINYLQADGTYKSITYSRLDPLPGTLSMAADFAYYAQREEDQGTIEALATASVVGIYEYAMQSPFLQGVSDLSRTMMNSDPEVAAENTMQMMGEKLGSGVISLLPSVAAGLTGAELERAISPEMSNAMMPSAGLFNEDPTQLPAFLRGFYTALQKAKARNPIFSDQLPPKLNLWGEVITSRDANSSAGLFSPFRVKTAKYEGVDAELMRLGNGPKMPPKKISGVLLNAEQYNRWIVLMNSVDKKGRLPGDKDYDETGTLLPQLNKMIETEEYKALDNDDKLDLINTIVSRLRTFGKRMLLQEYPDLQARVEAAK